MGKTDIIKIKDEAVQKEQKIALFAQPLKKPRHDKLSSINDFLDETFQGILFTKDLSDNSHSLP
jgi:hypothetical protein